MKGAVNQADLYINERISAKDSLFRRFANAFFTGRNELAGDRPAGDLRFELNTRPDFARLDLEDHVAVLAPPTALLDEAAVSGRTLCNGFAVRHLGLTNRYVYIELSSQPTADDVLVELAHSGQKRLS